MQVYAQGLHEDISDAKSGELVGHDLAGGEHPVKIPIEFAHIGFNIGGKPRPHAVAHQQWQVGVVEADDRHIQLAPGIQGCPGGQVRVAHFDQIGL